MIRRLFQWLRKPLLLQLFLFNGVTIAVLTACYYRFADKLWQAEIFITTPGNVGITELAARGLELVNPMNLLPHDVAIIATYAFLCGNIAIFVGHSMIGSELRNQNAEGKKEVAEKLRAAEQLRVQAEVCLQAAMAREEAAEAAERAAEEREAAAAQREADANESIQAKDEEVEKMSAGLTRLKRQNKGMRDEIKRLNKSLNDGNHTQ